MAIPDEEVIEELTTGGAKLEDYFVIDTGIYVVNKNGELLSMVIEEFPGEEYEGEMYDAIMNFLNRRGVKVYETWTEYMKQGHQQ